MLRCPFFFFALYEKNGQPLEKILKNYINTKYRRPKVRPYVTNNIYSAIEKQILLEQEVDRIVGNKKKTALPKEKPLTARQRRQIADAVKKGENAGQNRNERAGHNSLQGNAA